MIVGFYNRPFSRKSLQFVEIYKSILTHNQINFIDLDIYDPQFWEEVNKLDLFVFRWPPNDTANYIARNILPVIENELGVKCLPNQSTCWHYDDKIKQYSLLMAHKLPVIQSYIFFDEFAALSWTRKASYPVVFKLKNGAGSQNVILVKTARQANKLVRRMFGYGIKSGHVPSKDALQNASVRAIVKAGASRLGFIRKLYGLGDKSNAEIQKGYVLFQKFHPNNNFDTRVTVIGNRAFGFRRFTRKNDFRASGSGHFDQEPKNIDLKCVERSLSISKILEFQTMSYDFLYNKNNEPELCEMSYTYADWAVQSCPGYWDSELNWKTGRYWPQYFQLMDALELPDLKQPDLEP